jgi:hypothetical protein
MIVAAIIIGMPLLLTLISAGVFVESIDPAELSRMGIVSGHHKAPGQPGSV